MKKVILFNILVISLVVFFLEILLRLFLDITPQGVSKGIINQELSNINFNYPNISKGKVFGSKIFTDSNGFRISPGQTSNNDSPNIYFVGGSVTFGNGIKQSETFTGILNNRLQNINIHNLGVIGSDIKNNYNILEKKIKGKKVKKIFITFSLDDLDGVPRDLNSSHSINQKTLISKLKKNIILIKINNFIRSKSVIYVWTKGVIFNAEKKYYEFSLNAFNSKKNLDYLEEYLDLISLHVQKNNYKIEFVVLPYSQQLKVSNCKKNDFAENVIEENLIKRKFKYIKIKDFFCKEANKNKIFLKHDPAHLSKYGHKTIANIILNRIL
tara:strand:- start:27 stop:1004 length:978 start_codon:yes stop_codon:yes gene_type:complete